LKQQIYTLLPVKKESLVLVSDAGQ